MKFKSTLWALFHWSGRSEESGTVQYDLQESKLEYEVEDVDTMYMYVVISL